MIRILFVDDDATLLDVGKLFLEKNEGFSVRCAPSGEVALALMEKDRSDIVVADYQMPGMDGIALLKKIRSTNMKLPFILFTGKGREEIAVEALNEGADFYIQKGGSAKAQYAELAHKIRMAVERRGTEAAFLESEQRLRSILDSIQIGIVTIDAADHTILTVNPKAAEMIGKAPGEIIGSACHRFICPAQEGNCPVTDLGQTVDLSERTLLTAQGTKVPILKSVISSSAAGLEILIESFFDLTERKRSEEAFQTLIRSMIGGTGLESLNTITTNVNRWLDVDFTLILEFPEGADHATILSCRPKHDVFSEGSVIPVRGTPCGVAAERGFFLCEDNLQEAFPGNTKLVDLGVRAYVGTALRNADGDVVGTLCAYSTRPLHSPPRLQELMEIISIKAAAEIEHKKIEELLQQRNLMLTRINNLESAFSEISTGIRVEERAARKLSALSGAAVTVFSTYDPADSSLSLRVLEFAPELLERVPDAREIATRLLGKSPEEIRFPVTGAMLQELNRVPVMVKKAVHEASYGTIPREAGEALQKLAGIDRFIQIAHQFEGELYSTSVLGMRAGQPDPSPELLASFAHIIAVSLSRKRAAEALRESENLNTILVENLPDYIVVYGPDGTILYVNPASADVLGYRQEDLIGQSVLSFVSEQYRPVAAKNLASRKDGTAPPLYEIEITGKEGRNRLVMVKGTSLMYNEVPATLLVLVDITEQSRAQVALRESEEKFRTLVNQSLDGIAIVDLAGTILFANDSARKLSGYDTAPEGKVNVFDLVAPECRKIALADFARVATGTDGYLATYRILSRDRKELWIECFGKKILYEGADALLLSLHDISGRREAEQALHDSEERFRMLLENVSSLAIQGYTLDGTTRYWNPASERVYGYTAAEAIGKNLLDLIIPPEMRTEVKEAIQTMGRTGIPIPGAELSLMRKDGSRVEVYSSHALLSRAGHPLELFCIDVDMTEPRQMEAVLRDSEESYRGLFNTIRQAIYILDSDGKFVDVNAGAEAMYGYARAEFAGKTPEFLSAPGKNNLPEVVERLRKALDGESQKIEFWGRRKNGEIFPKDVWLYPGKYFGRDVVVAIGSDITDRKRAEGAEREKRFLLDMSQEMAHIGSWTLDLMSNRLVWSDEVYRIFGIRPQEFQGSYEAFLERVHPEDRAAVDAAYSSSLRDGADTYEIVHRVVRRDTGEIRVVHEKCLHKRDAAGTIVRSVGMVQDITERMQAEEDIRHANRQLRLMTSITGHDINNKLAVIIGYLTLARTKSGDPMMSEFITKVESAVGEIQAQIEFTKIYQDLGAHAPAWNDLSAVLAGLNPPPDIRIVPDLPALEIYADPMFNKVFYNLLDNSARHGARVTRIAVSARQDAGVLTILWEDDGVGIASGEKEKIFSRGVGKNTGLGLFLVREILTVTGITIRETGEPGKGARFEISVPQGEFRIREA